MCATCVPRSPLKMSATVFLICVNPCSSVVAILSPRPHHSTTSAPNTNVLPFLVVEWNKVGRSCSSEAARGLAQSVCPPLYVPLAARSRFCIATRSLALPSTVNYQLSTVNCPNFPNGPLSNRQTRRIETPLTHRKQTTATRSNRQKFVLPETLALTRLRDFAILAHRLPRRMP